MLTPSEVVRKLLLDLNLGDQATYTGNSYTGPPWPVFATNEPGFPDNCITVYDTVGNIDGRDMFGSVNEHFGLQVRVRSLGHTDGQTRANLIRDAFTGVVNEEVSSETLYFLIPCFARFTPVMYLGTEEPTSRRSLFTFNVTAAIRRM